VGWYVACLVEFELQGDEGAIGRHKSALHPRGYPPLSDTECYIHEVQGQPCAGNTINIYKGVTERQSQYQLFVAIADATLAWGWSGGRGGAV
jgi:hypothetical protein